MSKPLDLSTLVPPDAPMVGVRPKTAPPVPVAAAARAHRLLPADQFNLNRACQAIVDAFDWNVYHVGSSLRALTEGTPWRDVDVRCMLDDDEFDRMFPGAWPSAYDEPTSWRLALLNTSMSEWLAARTGLPIDFQFQRLTQANAKFSGPGGRSALGIFVGSHAKERAP